MNTINPYFLNLSENPRKAALQILIDADLDAIPIDLIKLAKKQDWNLIFEDFDDPEYKYRDGRFEIDGNKQISIFINTDRFMTKGAFSTDPTERLRQRFTLAHELGHAHFESHKSKDLQDVLAVEVNPHGRQYGYKREAQANEFASELLMPQWHLEKNLKTFCWDNFFKGVDELMNEYDISMLACATRTAKMAPTAAMLLHFDSAGKLANTPACSRDQADTKFYLPYGERIPQHTLVDDLANKPDFDGWCRRQNDCTMWFPTGKLAKNYSLIEQARRVGRHGFLVFLSFEEKEQEY